MTMAERVAALASLKVGDVAALDGPALELDLRDYASRCVVRVARYRRVSRS
jgi:hypothetical protein